MAEFVVPRNSRIIGNLVVEGDLGTFEFTGDEIKLPNEGTIRWRNFADNANLIALTVDDSDRLVLGSSAGIVEVNLPAAKPLTWGDPSDTKLFRDAPWKLALRDGTNENEFRIYKTFTDFTNFERLSIYSGGGNPEFVIETETAGTGSDNLDLIFSTSGASSVMRFRINAGATHAIEFGNGSFTFSGASMSIQGVTNLLLTAAGKVQWGNDVKLFRDAPWELALRDGTNANIFYVYKTFTDSSNYERLAFYTGGSANFFIETQTAGTGNAQTNLTIIAKGSSGEIDLKPAGIAGMSYRFQPTRLLPSVANIDIGVIGAEFRNLFAATDISLATQNDGKLSWGNAQDVQLWRDAPDTLALRRGLNDQFFYVYGTFTDAANYERLALYAGSSVTHFLEPQSAGTGADDINLTVRALGSGNLTLGDSANPSGLILRGKILQIRDNNAQLNITTVTATVVPAGASVTAVNLIPNGVLVLGVTTTVLTSVTGPAGYDVGDGVDVDRWGNSVPVSGGNQSNISKYTSSAITYFPSTNDVVITSDGVDFTGGLIRIVVHTMSLNAASN